MALANRNGINMVHLNAHMKDATTSGAGLCYAAVTAPVRGRLVRLKAVAYAATVSGLSIVTKIGTVTVTGGTWNNTVFATLSGAAAGLCYSLDATNSPIVQQGDVISFNSDGANAADGTVPFTFQASIRRI